MPSRTALHPRAAWHLPFALTGMLLFGTSLAAGVWLYMIVLGAPATTGGAGAVLADAGLFSVFALHHSVMARCRAKDWLARHAAPHLERAVYVWCASILFLVVCAAWRPVAGVAWQAYGWLAAGAHLAQAAGVLLTLAGASVLDPADLAGVRQVREVTGEGHREAAPLPLSRRGPYAWVRHPIYLGWLLMTFAAPSMTTGRLVFAVVSTAYLVVAIPFEERGLVAAHGDDYRAYQREVRWRMVPWVY